ncbi:zinc-binding dehydrogenase family protein [Mycobacterium kansasii]|uniref:Zinc-binding dehydrogenase family protein n=1 Tax=Mycobacterium kansasii TaxID=1768 RepID=A0A1V3XGC9_MYCKA|nr:zinc-binding dehydrogenase family protein [Mycobacterium kansasii]
MLSDMGIDHVYDSRSIDFAEQIRRDTDGYGVDIVLNSLTGAAQRAGLELLSWGGRFVEIGKRDIYGDTKMGLFPFRRNLSFYGVDLGMMSLTHPQYIRELLSTVYRLTADGTLPMPESTHYPLADAATAIRVMGAADHTGKLILDIPRAGSSSVVLPPSRYPSSVATAPTSSPVAWVAWGSSWPRRWPPPAPGESYSAPGPLPAKRPWRQSNSSARSDPMSWWSAPISPRPAPRSGWWPMPRPPDSRCAVCSTRLPWSRTPH